jgi:hypothetical protein
MAVIGTVTGGIDWAIIRVKGIHLGPHGEIGGLQIILLFAGLASCGWLAIIGSKIREVCIRSGALRWPIRALGATLNLALVLFSTQIMFSQHGLLATMHGSFVQVEQRFDQKVNEDPAQHPCVDGGKPATTAVVYGGNPGIIRWYCDPSKAPRFIEVPSGAVPVPANAPINLLLYVLVLIAQIVALAFAFTLFGHELPVVVPRFARHFQQHWDGVFGFGTGKSSFGAGMFFVYVVVFLNIVVQFLPKVQSSPN